MKINDIIRKKINTIPNKTFIIFNNEKYTWLDVEKASQIVADDLTKLGVKENSHVGICCSNSPNWIITFIAICKLNAMPILLNPASNVKEILVVADGGDIEYLCYGNILSDISEDVLINELINNSCIKRCYSINKEKNIKNRFNEYDGIPAFNKGEYDKDDLKVMMFTSGSTGVPKGVLHSIDSIMYRANVHIKTYGLTSEDKYCLVLPLFHIFALYTILFAAIASEGAIVIPENIKTSTIIKSVKEEGCTNLNVVPTLMIAILANENFNKDDFKTLKLTLIGGAASTTEQMKKFQETMPDNHIINGYGLTEACPATQTQYTDTIEQKVSTVGRPYDGIEIKVVDNKTNIPCKNGEVGEILVKGYCNMVSYYKPQKEDTTISKDGWVHTGDLGYINEDGYLCLSGRIKDIIIRGGENIMPLEIAAAIGHNEAIKDVKVIGVPDEFRGEEVVACLTLKSQCKFDELETRKIVAGCISKHKLPKYYLVFDELPKLSNGKIDGITLKKIAIERLTNKMTSK